ncbi:MAG: histidine kinase N-terminal 7TM domain-containing protein, partial [bacterium]
MNFQYIPYLWLLAISATITLFLAFFAYRYRKVKGAKAFGLSMLIFTFWTICHGLEMAGTDLSTKLFWANIQYFSYTTINIAWLYMVLQFTGYTHWCRAKRV